MLDLGLPDVDGLTVLSMLRAVSSVPVVVATARDDEKEIVRALDLGADDYLVKPFGGDQLEARIRAVLRRAGHDAPPTPIVVGGLVITSASREVTVDGIPVELSRKEFDLLHLLAQRVGEVVTKREILTFGGSVCGWSTRAGPTPGRLTDAEVSDHVAGRSVGRRRRDLVRHPPVPARADHGRGASGLRDQQ